MITFPNEFIKYLNIVLIIWLLVNVARGYRKGLLLLVVDLVGTAVALFAAWVFAPVMVKIFQFVTPPGSGLITIDQLVTQQINQLIWFLILFVVARVLLFFVTPLASAISKVPVVKQVNSFVGGAFSIVIFVFKVFILIYFLTFPVIKNGQDIIDNTWLKPISETQLSVLEGFENELNQNEAIQSLIMNRSLTDDQEEQLVEWLEDKGINEVEIKEYLEDNE